MEVLGLYECHYKYHCSLRGLTNQRVTSSWKKLWWSMSWLQGMWREYKTDWQSRVLGNYILSNYTLTNLLYQILLLSPLCNRHLLNWLNQSGICFSLRGRQTSSVALQFHQRLYFILSVFSFSYSHKMAPLCHCVGILSRKKGRQTHASAEFIPFYGKTTLIVIYPSHWKAFHMHISQLSK